MPFLRRRKRPTTRRAPTRRRPRRVARKPRMPRKRVSKLRRTVNMVSPIAESKLSGEVRTLQNITMSNASGRSFGLTALSLGEKPIPYLAGGSQAGSASLWDFAQGIGKNQRDGRSLFIKQTSLTARLEFNPHYTIWGNTKTFIPQKCRLLCIRGKRVNDTEPNNVLTNLFYDQLGNNKGLGTSLTAYALDKFKINRSRWDVIMDRRTTLAPSNITSKDDPSGSTNPTTTRQFNSKYRAMADFNFTIPCNKKIRYNDPSDPSPSNLDTQYFFLCINTPIGADFDGGGNFPAMTDDLMGLTLMGKTSALDL